MDSNSTSGSIRGRKPVKSSVRKEEESEPSVERRSPRKKVTHTLAVKDHLRLRYVE